MNTLFTFADLCAGIGGFRIGLERVGGKCLFSSDIDKNCEKTYQANHYDSYDDYDIHKINEKKFPKIDVLCAGFPCQPFSIAGKRSGFDDKRGSVFFKISSIVKSSKPKIVFLENVSNLLRMNSGQEFKIIFKNLEDIGYNVYYDVLDSSGFGVPQSRNRIYIIAIRSDIESFGFALTKKRTRKIPFKQVIEQGDNSIPITDKWNTYIDLYTGKITASDVPFELPKTRKALERIDNDADLDDCIFQIRSSGIRALSINKPLPTFAVSVSGGGAMIPVYSKERRHLSLVEMKRLMGFSDDFIFPVSRTNAIKQLANAVCPPVITSIGKDFLPYILKKRELSLVEDVSINQYI